MIPHQYLTQVWRKLSNGFYAISDWSFMDIILKNICKNPELFQASTNLDSRSSLYLKCGVQWPSNPVYHTSLKIHLNMWIDPFPCVVWISLLSLEFQICFHVPGISMSKTCEGKQSSGSLNGARFMVIGGIIFFLIFEIIEWLLMLDWV